MKKNIAVWFLIGFVCGLGSLLAAVVLLRGDLHEHSAPQQTKLSDIEKEIQHETLGLLKQFNRILDKVEAQFTEPSNDARESALSSDLQTVRSQLELYKIQHLDRYPGIDPSDGSFDPVLFEKQLTCRTDTEGRVGTDPTSYPFGPYLQRLPSNPFVEELAAKVKGGPGPCPGDGETGWYFDLNTGVFSPNDPEHKDE
ncbi:MAG: hypothetical protein ACYTF6_01475 [Planctomycetota bacterium]|jgi:general secretion pathway protein G